MTQRPQVMVVEDESLVALMMEDLLAELGCDVVASFASIWPAIEWLEDQEEAPDGALLDVNLGGQLVFPLAEELKERSVPFAFATGYGALSDERFASCPVIHKPVDLGKLASVIGLFAKAA